MQKTIAKILLTALLIPIILTGCTNSKVQRTFSDEAYGYFCEILKIPHGSGNEKAISDYLVSFAGKNSLEVIQDESWNVLIKKPGSKGRENESPIVLQAHMDMVCEKNNGVNHDFLKDPIIPVIDGDFVKASGTTLGADNASGLSQVLAVLASNELSHPPIEAVITTQEETGMVGAIQFDTSLLTGTRFINVDSEEEGVFTVSCASASEVNVIIPAEYEKTPEGFDTYTLTVKGLSGGHSGLDIDKGRANANLLMANLLDKMQDEEIYMSSINGGSRKNAIPRECTAVISFAASDLDKIKSIAAQAEKEFKSEYLVDEELAITLEKTDSAKKVMKADSAKKLLEGILLVPNGVLSMSQNIEGLVQTSNNIGVIVTDGETVTLTTYLRSSVVEEQEQVIEQLELLGSDMGVAVTVDRQSPAWEYREDSPLRDAMIEIYEEMYGKKPDIAAIHAGLECSVFSEKMPDGDFISIGADIINAHSPDERMSISSYNRVCDYLVKLLEKM